MADNGGKMSAEIIPENAQDLTLFVQNLLEQMIYIHICKHVCIYVYKYEHNHIYLYINTYTGDRMQI
jgi:ATP-dependent protease ClpP protease subunit